MNIIDKPPTLCNNEGGQALEQKSRRFIVFMEGRREKDGYFPVDGKRDIPRLCWLFWRYFSFTPIESHFIEVSSFCQEKSERILFFLK